MPRWKYALLLAFLPVCFAQAGHLRASEDALAEHDDDKAPDATEKSRDAADKSEDKSEEKSAAADETASMTPAVLEQMVKAIRSELEDKAYQWLVALLAFTFGCVLVFDGEFCLRWLIACCVFLVVASMAMDQVTHYWGQHRIRYFVGLEAGSIGAFAAFKGMDGMRVSVGALLGALVAMKSSEFFQEHGLHFIFSHRWVELVYYSVLAVLCSSLLYKNKHLKVLAVLSAGLGGAFCSSAIAYMVTALAAKGYLGLDNALPGLTPKSGTWVEFFHMLWSSKAPLRGVFVDSSYNPSAEGREFSLDKIADDCLWLVFWLAGSLVQLRRLRTESPTSSVREPLLGELPK